MSFYDCLSISALLKILETCSIFTCLMLHRIGFHGQQIFFGATDMQLDVYDYIYPKEVDTEIIGSGALVAFSIVTPMILLAYAVEGRKKVQSTTLDMLFSFVGATIFITAGGMCCFAWNNSDFNSILQRRHVVVTAGSLGVLMIFTGILYLIDFFYAAYLQAKYAD